MRTRTKWLVAGGAAACVLAPVVAVSASTSLDQSLERGGVMVDAELANRARADRLAAAAKSDPTASPPAPSTAETKASVAKAKKSNARPTKEPTGKKTVSAETPVSPPSATSPVSPRTPG